MFLQENKSKIPEYLLLVILAASYFAVGILKWNYILNPWLTEGPFLLNRYSVEPVKNYNDSYTDSLRYFLFTPKWISTLIFGNLFLFLNLSVIYIIYKEKVLIKFTFWAFFWVSFISFIALFLGYCFDVFQSVYVIVSRIKELQQSPFTLILLLSAFKLIKQNKANESVPEK